MSPRGFEGAREAAESINQRKSGFQNGSSGERILYFSLPKSGDHAVVRFLEQGEEIFWCWSHEIPRSDRAWGDWVPCVDQKNEGSECPGCQHELTRRFKGYINVIWRNAPIYKREENGRLEKDASGERIIIDRGDQVAVWNQGIQVFEDLDDKDVTYKGLMSRDFRITRKGEKKNTRYAVDPADPDGGPQEMSASDKKLADKKHDLNQFVTPPSIADFMGRLGNVNASGGEEFATPRNPFLSER